MKRERGAAGAGGKDAPARRRGRRRPAPYRNSITKAAGYLERYATRAALMDALNAISILGSAGESLTAIAAAHLRRRPGGGARRIPCVTLGELFLRKTAQYSADQARSVRAMACARRFFCGKLGEDTPVDELDDGKVEAALSGMKNPESWNSLFRRLRLALNWGVREGLVERSPIARLRTRHVDWREPSHFEPERVERILRMAEEHPGTLEGAVGAQLALGFFAGARTAEILRARWEDIDLDGATFRIPRPKGWTRGQRPRLVELEPAAVAWLRLWRDWTAIHSPGGRAAGLIVSKPYRLRQWKALYLEPNGDSWGNDAAHNVMRHTYATMHVAAYRNAAATALNLGHGRGTEMLERHYRGLVAKSVALRHWGIFPSGRPVPPPDEPPGRGRRTDLIAARLAIKSEPDASQMTAQVSRSRE